MGRPATIRSSLARPPDGRRRPPGGRRTLGAAVELTVLPHPLLALRAFVTQFPSPLGRLSRDAYRELLAPGARAPVRGSDEVRTVVRDLLRHGGYKPTGRGKPASEYLVRAAAEGKLGPINPAVDVGNVVSLHAGLPISVVDVDRLQAPVRVDLAPAGAKYVFNASGQEIDLEGLLCLFDAEGPCANAVKDSTRTKTSDATTTTLTLGRVNATVDLVEVRAPVEALSTSR